MAGTNQRWELSQEAFDRLLTALGDDRRAAADRYERIRARLIKFFVWERCPFPEDHADQAINRVAKRVAEGEKLLSPESYFYGAARMLLKEIAAEQRRSARVMAEFRQQTPAQEAEEDQLALDCLRRCLATLGSEQRAFLLQYYQGDGAARIESRKRMAETLQLPLNAVRNRALRLREKIENCVSNCLSGKRAP